MADNLEIIRNLELIHIDLLGVSRRQLNRAPSSNGKEAGIDVTKAKIESVKQAINIIENL